MFSTAATTPGLAGLDYPGNVAVDSARNLFIAGFGRIRKVSHCVITTCPSHDAGYNARHPAGRGRVVSGRDAPGGMGHFRRIMQS
jgi:hypothetical protein